MPWTLNSPQAFNVEKVTSTITGFQQTVTAGYGSGVSSTLRSQVTTMKSARQAHNLDFNTLDFNTIIINSIGPCWIVLFEQDCIRLPGCGPARLPVARPGPGDPGCVRRGTSSSSSMSVQCRVDKLISTAPLAPSSSSNFHSFQ